MILYNVTIKVDWHIHDEWLLWMKKIHMPAVLATGSFYDAKLMRLLETDDTEGPTYAAQYFAHDEAAYQQYVSEYAAQLRQEGIQKWGNAFVAFRSVMQVVN
ncbi:MAG: DUF4286 family protein [Chitinophagaceae bacterium]